MIVFCYTNATLLIAQGINVRTVAGRLGHSQTSTTMDIYSHELRSADAAAADALEGILGKKKDKPLG
jgi:integrase